ncbi:hypothetical protein [Nostoc sp. 106C]|uniref:hypothetical protein n=1 Tax=Nostoc sp. 106C TaxID=1932667 RepID=UPI000A37B519|nr:hypothetical protein [Nostoc sp. 106C]OUL26614.1 hypothetical protein BV375_21065 [Nostoc sp. 106C]
MSGNQSVVAVKLTSSIGLLICQREAQDNLQILTIWQPLFFYWSFNRYSNTTEQQRSCTKNEVKVGGSSFPLDADEYPMI